MSKLIAFLFIVAMGVQIVKPLGLPGLKRRMDFWKIAVAALAATIIVLMLRPS
ncbi:hypothetical protein [Martelella endophytica]|uniref:hypothetical protein n=1 Tax=Martelella endophytica TaxID=1486262 RepID=UPI000B0792A6|nr:hypothetical protein [Martelella endophytica]